MDTRFHPAIAKIKTGDLEGLKSLLQNDRSLATDRSSVSHPTLLQCLALEAIDVPNQVELAKALVDAGAEINEPLCACASIDNVAVGEFLLDAGAKVDGTGGWSPLEEALYWANQKMLQLLLDRGARVQNLRTAAGLGRIDLVRNFFTPEGQLKPEAGRIAWPFGDPRESNLSPKIKEELQAKMDGWSDNPVEIINNAFIYACMGNHIEVARFLLARGAEVNSIPAGFDYSGTGLHYAALRGHREMCDLLLEHGADKGIRDTKVGSSPSGWANYGGHTDLRDYLQASSPHQTPQAN